MKSRTKNLLSEEQIRKLVKVNFGDACKIGSIVELKGGMFNSVYLIKRMNENDKIVLKVGVVPGTTLLTYEQDVMPTEVECFKLINEQTTIPTPKVIAYDFSKKQINSNYFFMTAMEGISLNKISRKMQKQNLEKIRVELAGYLAQMHQIKGNYFGYFSDDKKYQYATWKEAFLSMFDMILRDGRKHKVKLPYERIEKILKDNEIYLDEITIPSLVEYDCHEGNIFVKKVGEEYVIEGILDFERAFWGDPVADFPAAFIMLDDIRKEEAFLKSYLKESKVKKQYTEADATRYQLYRMYIFTIMAAETFRYGFLYAHLQGSWSKSIVMKCLNELEKALTKECLYFD